MLFDEAASRTRRRPESISEINDQVTNLQFTQDVPIWEHKIYRERPIVTKMDGPVTQYRRWFRQFYSNGLSCSAIEGIAVGGRFGTSWQALRPGVADDPRT